MANAPVGHAMAQVECRLDLSGSWTLRKYEFCNDRECMELDRPLVDVSGSSMKTDDSNSGNGKRARSHSEQSNRTADPNKDADRSSNRTTSHEPGKTILQRLEETLEVGIGKMPSTPIEGTNSVNNADPAGQYPGTEVEDDRLSPSSKLRTESMPPSALENAHEVKNLVSSMLTDTTTATSPTKKAAKPRALKSGKGWDMFNAAEAPKALYDQAEVPDINQPRGRRKSTLDNSKALEAKCKWKAEQAGLGTVDEEEIDKGIKKISTAWKANKKGVSGAAAASKKRGAATAKPGGKGKGRAKEVIEIPDDEEEDGKVAKKRKTAEAEEEREKEKETPKEKEMENAERRKKEDEKEKKEDEKERERAEDEGMEEDDDFERTELGSRAPDGGPESSPGIPHEKWKDGKDGKGKK